MSTPHQKTGFGRFFIARSLVAAFALLALLAGNATRADDEAAGAMDERAEREITALIAAVETSECFFIRNGDRHGAATAADHLRLKYRKGRRYADTAEHFIERLAAKSSWSGKPYFIECDGEQSPSGDWLSSQLELIRQ